MRMCKNALCRVWSYKTQLEGKTDQSCPSCGKVGDRV